MSLSLTLQTALPPYVSLFSPSSPSASPSAPLISPLLVRPHLYPAVPCTNRAHHFHSNLQAILPHHTWSWGPLPPETKAPSPSGQYPLREVAGWQGIMRVHLPFSFSDLEQTEKRLGSFWNDPTKFTKKFKYLTQTMV